VELRTNMLADDGILIDMGTCYYKQIYIQSPQAAAAVATFKNIFSQEKADNQAPHVFEGIQKYRHYDEIDVTITVTPDSFKSQQKVEEKILHEYSLSDLIRWVSHNDKITLVFKSWFKTEDNVILASQQSKEIITYIEQLCNKLAKKK